MKIVIDPTKPYVRDMTKEGWTLPDGDIEYRPGEVELEFCEFLKFGESWIKGTEMAKRAVKLGANLGQKHAEALLENQNLIPPEFRHFYLTFPGTVWLDSSGDRHVPCLSWYGEQCSLLFHWLEFDWRSRDRLLRPRK